MMKDWKQCSHCDEPFYDLASLTHEGLGRYEVYCKERGEQEDSAVNICAYCPVDAATRWAERDDGEGDYDIIRRGKIEDVMVRKLGADNWRAFNIAAESVPEYTANEKEKE